MADERPLYRRGKHLRLFHFFCSVLVVPRSIQLAIFFFDVFYNSIIDDDRRVALCAQHRLWGELSLALASSSILCGTLVNVPQAYPVGNRQTAET